MTVLPVCENCLVREACCYGWHGTVLTNSCDACCIGASDCVPLPKPDNQMTTIRMEVIRCPDDSDLENFSPVCVGCGGPKYIDPIDEILSLKQRVAELERRVQSLAFFPRDTYYYVFGDVLWWRLPVNAPPWVGTPSDSSWPDDYYTHYSFLPENADVLKAEAAAMKP